MFNAEEYSAAIDKLICSMTEIRGTLDPEMPDILKEICGLLRIGRIETRIYQSAVKESSGEYGCSVIYDNGSADSFHFEKIRETLGNGNIVHYCFYPISGAESRTEEETEKINVLGKLLYAFRERANLINIAEKLSFYDSELGIHNMAYFIRKFSEFIGNNTIGKYAVCHFNLRRFSVVNNQVGRETGTAVMKAFAEGLQNKLGKDEYVCRVGGDNFTVVFKKENLDTVIGYLGGTKIKDPVHSNGPVFFISAYQGYAILESDIIFKATDAMERAYVAFSTAKKNPTLPYVIYNDDIRATVNHAKAIEDMFPEALQNEEFLVYYQPKVNLKDYTLVGAEALSRWRHNGVMIQPGSFIPILERSKLICKLDFYVLEHVCRDIRKWLDEGRKVVRVSVNLSRIHLGDRELLEDIMKIIEKYRVPHEYIEIELTETTTRVDYSELKKIVSGLREQGINTSVDDFGMGYSSLNLIRELPWKVLKIDKSFLPDSSENSKQKSTMLKYVIAMAHDLGLQCIVEGVETVDHIMLLKENNCFVVQGFYFDRPLPKNIFENRLDGLIEPVNNS